MKPAFQVFALYFVVFTSIPDATHGQQKTVVVESIEKMRALSDSPDILDGRLFHVTGTRGGFFIFDKTSKAQTDSGTCFGGPNSVGRFLRQHDGSAFHVHWFGAITTNSMNDFFRGATAGFLTLVDTR